MTNATRVVRAITADVTEIRGLLLASAFDLYAGATADRYLIAWLRASVSAESIAACVRDRQPTLLAAVDSRCRVVGTGRVNDMGYISHIAASRAGAGIGGAVLDGLLAVAGAAPWMSVWTGNTAMLTLASSRGFVPVSADPDERYLPDLRFQILQRADSRPQAVATGPVPRLVLSRAV